MEAQLDYEKLVSSTGRFGYSLSELRAIAERLKIDPRIGNTKAKLVEAITRRLDYRPEAIVTVPPKADLPNDIPYDRYEEARAAVRRGGIFVAPPIKITGAVKPLPIDIDLDVLRGSAAGQRVGYSAEELRNFAIQLGVGVSGTKSALIRQIIEGLERGTPTRVPTITRAKTPPAAITDIDYNILANSLGRQGYTLNQLKDFAKRYNLAVSGTKADLIARLQTLRK